MEKDEMYFIKEQLSWLGIDYSHEIYIKGKAGYSQEEVAWVESELEKIYSQDNGLISKNTFNTFKQTLLPIAATINSAYEGKAGNCKSVNNALELLPEWGRYQFNSISLQKDTYYELKFDGKSPYKIDESLTFEKMETIISCCDEHITEEACQSIFGCPIPKCLSENMDALKAYINEKMKATEHFKNFMVKQQGGGSLRLMSRPGK